MIIQITLLLCSLLITPNIICMEATTSSFEESSKSKDDSSKNKRTLLKRTSSITSIKKFSSKKKYLDLQDINIETEHNKTDKNGNTPLIYAVQHNQESSVEQLLKYQDLKINHLNKWGMTALHYATARGNLNIIHLLINDKRIDASICNKEGLKASDCLEEIMTDFHTVQNKLHKNIILHLQKYNNQHYFNLKELIASNNLNVYDKDNTSPLIWAICTNQKNTYIKKMISSLSHDVNHADDIFGTALHYAVLLGSSHVVKMLLLHPRTDGSIKNKLGLVPHGCLLRDTCKNENKCNEEKKCSSCLQYEKMRLLLFSRIWLNKIVESKTFEVIMEQGLSEATCEFQIKNETLSCIIEAIKKYVTTEDEHQASELPANACLPKYATDDFLKQMIQYSYIKRWIK